MLFLAGLRIGDAPGTNQWKSLLKIAFDLIATDNVVERLSLHTTYEFLSKVLHLSNIHSSTWRMVQTRFKLFHQILNDRKLQQASCDTKYVVMKMVNFVQHLLRRDNRHLICDLGEQNAYSGKTSLILDFGTYLISFSLVIALYEDEKTLVEVIKFFRFQMSLHHPRHATNFGKFNLSLPRYSVDM